MKHLALYAGPLAALLAFVLLRDDYAIAITAAVAAICVLWWVFEPVPIPVTSLLPLAIFQISGVLDKNQVGQAYGSPLILLLLGGFILSKAMERSGAHRRLA
ncbi:MAG TPA: SLC13/DASS family transporter, partial [Thiotrichales bacterium]|nr:SLC13/DASS family transporter [Thiotrichales bacterium]